MNRLGQRIKRKRESLHLQLNDLAKKVGITSSALSQIENAKAFPSIITLKAIADNLHVTVGELIGENEKNENNPITKAEQITFLSTNESGSKLFSLSQTKIDKNMNTFKIVFIEGSDSKGIFEKRNRQEFCYVTKGTIDFVINDILHEMNEGDSAYFNAQEQPLAKNSSTEIAEMIWVTPHI